MHAPIVDIADVPAYVAAAGLVLDDDNAPIAPLAFVDLSSTRPPVGEVRDAAAAAERADVLLVGLADEALPDTHSLAAALACTLVAGGRSELPRTMIGVADLDAARAVISMAVSSAPRAARTLDGLLRLTSTLAVREGLIAESLAYSMLLAGDEFRRWRASRPIKRIPAQAGPAVLLDRDADTLHVTLNRPHRHNAFGVPIRDGLVDAFDLVLADPTIAQVTLRGNGSSFCSGGDLDEFGPTTDVTSAHLIRLDRGVGARLDRCRDRVHARLHGACIGAGIEIPSFAAHVSAADGTCFALPEMSMGLVPGAGGTVGVTRRIGRWRTAYLGLTGERLDVATALSWGLIDERG